MRFEALHGVVLAIDELDGASPIGGDEVVRCKNEEPALVRYEELIGRLSHVLREASFLLRLTIGQTTYEEGVFDSFSGVRRPVRAQIKARLPSALDGDLYLFDSNSMPLLRMHQLVQALEPSPDESPEVFLFSGAGRHGARLVPAPREFERQDEMVWPWFDATWPRVESPAKQHEAQKKPPYRSLASFTASDAQDTFGREAEAEAVANRLRVRPFLAVVCPSGVGQSSFVKAGVAPLLSRAEALELLGSSAAGARVLEALINARLLVTSEGADGDDRVEIIHEALLLSWPRLVQWQRENAELARMRDNLRAAARQWQEQKRPRGMLWRDEVLTEYRLWRPKYPGALTQVEQAFAAASVNEFERGQRIRRGLLIAAFAVLSGGMVILVRAKGRAEANATRAEENARVSAHRMTLMTAEQGRVAFLAGRPANALTLLDTAIDGGVNNAGINYMRRKAARALASERRSMELPASSTSLAFNKNELVVSLSNSNLVFYNALTLKERTKLPVPKGAFRLIRFSTDGSKMIGCGGDGIVSVWEASANAQLAALQVRAVPLGLFGANADGSFVRRDS